MMEESLILRRKVAHVRMDFTNNKQEQHPVVNVIINVGPVMLLNLINVFCATHLKLISEIR